MITRSTADQIIEFINSLTSEENDPQVLPYEGPEINLVPESEVDFAKMKTPAQISEEIGGIDQLYRRIFPEKPTPTDQNFREILQMADAAELEKLWLYVWDIDQNQKSIGNPFPYSRAILKRGPNWDVINAVSARVHSQSERYQEQIERAAGVQETEGMLTNAEPTEMTPEVREKLATFAERFRESAGAS